MERFGPYADSHKTRGGFLTRVFQRGGRGGRGRGARRPFRQRFLQPVAIGETMPSVAGETAKAMKVDGEKQNENANPAGQSNVEQAKNNNYFFLPPEGYESWETLEKEYPYEKLFKDMLKYKVEGERRRLALIKLRQKRKKLEDIALSLESQIQDYEQQLNLD